LGSLSSKLIGCLGITYSLLGLIYVFAPFFPVDKLKKEKPFNQETMKQLSAFLPEEEYNLIKTLKESIKDSNFQKIELITDKLFFAISLRHKKYEEEYTKNQLTHNFFIVISIVITLIFSLINIFS